MAYVHEKCLIRWLSEKNISRCELCKHEIKLIYVFAFSKLFSLLLIDLKYYLNNRQRLIRFSLKGLCLIIYLRHFLPVVRFLRTKILRHLCKLWMIFEQEEKFSNANNFSWKNKASQVITKEIPITIKLMVFMWVLRKFVSIGGRYLSRITQYSYKKYQSSRVIKLVKQK